MFKNYFLVTIRSLLKRKSFVLINILGMGLAVAVCILAYLNWSFRHEWDDDQVNGERIYRIEFRHDLNGKEERYGVTPAPMAAHLRGNIAGIRQVTRFHVEYCNVRIGSELFNTPMAYGDSSFFDVFSVSLKYGATGDFKDPSHIFISDALARKYFNREDVVGEQITQINSAGPKEFTIAGVFRKWGLNSSFGFEAITLMENFWARHPNFTLKNSDWRQMVTTLVLLDDERYVGPVTRELQHHLESHNIAREDLRAERFYLQNFRGLSRDGIHPLAIKYNELRSAQPDAIVIVPIIMAAMLLLLACFNFMNTSIALSSQRLKEIGVRKVMGGLRKQLVAQFLGENLFLCILGFLAGLVIAEWLVPAYDTLWPWLELDFSYSRHAGLLLCLLSLLFFTAIVAGGYPAFYVTSFEPVSILKGTSRLRGTSWLTRVLLAFQFTISLVTIIFAVGFYNNARYQKNYDLGFHTTGVISVWLNGGSAFDTYRNALTGHNDILNIGGTKHHVINWHQSGSVTYGSMKKEIDVMDVGENYLETVNIRMVSGRGFEKDSETDRRESAIVSEEFVRQFGWTDGGVGKRLVWQDGTQLYVIGVAKDIFVRSLFQPVQPLMLRYTGPENYAQIVVQVPADRMAQANEFMKTKWKEIFPNDLYDSIYIDYSLQRTNETNASAIIIFSFLGFFAALMSATGLFTLVSLNILRRVKEIGIRKVLGASVIHVIGVISYEFVIILISASLLGGAIGYKMVDKTMAAAWVYYEKIGLATLGTSVVMIILLSVLTVGFKTVRAASMNPVKNLRTE